MPTPEEILKIMQGAKKKPAIVETTETMKAAIEKPAMTKTEQIISQEVPVNELILDELKKTNEILWQLRRILLGEPVGTVGRI